MLNRVRIKKKKKLINVEEFIKKMKKLTEHLHDEILIAQIIYKFNVNLFHHSCFKYFVEDEVWLNACNLSITHLTVKLNDCESLLLQFYFCIITMSNSWISLLIKNDSWIFNDFLMLYCRIHRKDCFIIKLFVAVVDSAIRRLFVYF